jgi:uncharacterized protein YqjF (DUF2071 family)
VHSTISTADSTTPSEAGRRRLLSKFGEPLFLARWDCAVFINYSVDPKILQRQVPFELDLRDGQAFVSVVAFTLIRMRPSIGGAWTEWLLKPMATHEFLNIRTYVRHNGEPGIFFLAEWLSNRISVSLGPRTFGLPYRFGDLDYKHGRSFQGSVSASDGRLTYAGEVSESGFGRCAPGSVDEFTLERYTAFTQRRKRKRLFRIWHPPWPQAKAKIHVTDETLISSTGRWWKNAEPIGANYSPGVEVWMGRPHRIRD